MIPHMGRGVCGSAARVFGHAGIELNDFGINTVGIDGHNFKHGMFMCWSMGIQAGLVSISHRSCISSTSHMAKSFIVNIVIGAAFAGVDGCGFGSACLCLGG